MCNCCKHNIALGGDGCHECHGLNKYEPAPCNNYVWNNTAGKQKKSIMQPYEKVGNE